MIPIHGRWIVAAIVAFGPISQARAQEQVVQIYLVQASGDGVSAGGSQGHSSDQRRRERAALLVPTLAGIRVSYLLPRTPSGPATLEALARGRSLPIVQLPRPGSTWNGHVVDDQMSRREAIQPIAAELLALPPGSTAVVGLNGEIFLRSSIAWVFRWHRRAGGTR